MHLGPEAWLWGLCICKSQELVLQKGNLRYERIVSGRGIYEVYEFFAQRELAALLASKVRHSASPASRHQRPVLGDLSRVSRVPRSET